jgi:adenosylcobinamide-GDP ribazoletransferase
MTRFLRHCLLALQSFSRIPVTGRLAAWAGWSPAMQQACTRHLPGVGWVVGAGCAAMVAGLHLALPAQPASAWVAAIAAITVSVLLTGGFHEDGLADLADGLGGAVSRERALDIMKDSRLGAYGAMALVLALLARAAALALLIQVDVRLALLAVLLGAVMSRFAPLWVMRALPHVGDADRSKSRAHAGSIDAPALLAAALWCLPAIALAQGLQPGVHWIAALVGAALGAAAVKRLLARRLGGYTGDGLGAVQQVSEIGLLLGLAVGLSAS